MSKYKTGYIAGVFDLFHVGHLNLIRRAKALCEHLIVGVVVDEVSIASKGKAPHMPLAERVEIMKAIRYVDQVVVVTPENLSKVTAWQQHRFDCLFSGDDWQGHPDWINEEKALNRLGAEIVFFPYTQGISSTQLRAAINAHGNGK